MKSTIHTLLLCFLVSSNFAQGIISDIMSVETVSLDLTEVNENLFNRYKETLAKEKSSMESNIASLDSKYQDDVSQFVDDYTKKLKNGEEKIVMSAKIITVSRVNSLSMTHRTDKKNIVQNFLNKMLIANRRLPDFLREDAELEVEALGALHFETIEDDYKAHKATIKAFEKQKHLIITEGTL